MMATTRSGRALRVAERVTRQVAVVRQRLCSLGIRSGGPAVGPHQPAERNAAFQHCPAGGAVFHRRGGDCPHQDQAESVGDQVAVADGELLACGPDRALSRVIWSVPWTQWEIF
jgi:hypothetical protein